MQLEKHNVISLIYERSVYAKWNLAKDGQKN